MKKGLRKVISLFCAVSMMLSCVPFRAVSDGDTGFEQEDILLPELTETPDPEPVEETAFTPSAEPDGETSGETAPEAPAEEAAAAQEVTAEAGQEDPGEENPETPPASAQEAPAEETPDTPGEPAAEEQALAQDVPVETPAEAGQEDPGEEPPETPAVPVQETPAETTTDTSGDPAEEGQEPVQDAPGIPAEDTQPENGEEDPETPEETGTDENREDRRIDLSREPERTEWITDGMLEEEKEFVIRITAGKETDLFFLLESNAGLDAVLTDEGHGHSKDFTKEHREADDGNTEGIPMVRYTLEAVHVEQGGSRLIRITGFAGTLFSLRVLTSEGWQLLQVAEDEPAEDVRTETADGGAPAPADNTGSEPQPEEPDQGNPAQPAQAETPACETESDVLIRYSGSEETVTVPDGIVEIGSRAFCGNGTIRRVILPDSVEIINNSAFADCLNLEKVVISGQSRLTTIGHLAFRNDAKLDISFAANVPNVISSAFEGAGVSTAEEENGESGEEADEEAENEEETAEEETGEAQGDEEETNGDEADEEEQDNGEEAGEEENGEDPEVSDEENDEEETDEDAEEGEEEELPLQESPLVSEGTDYTVTVVFGEDAGFPQGTELQVREILPGTEEYLLYSGRTEEILNENWDEVAEFARYFDIAFICNEEEIEPQAPIDVQITFAEAIPVAGDNDLQAIHFAEEGAEVIHSEAQSVEAAAREEDAVDTVAFSSDSFSVYGFVQTAKITEKAIAADGSSYNITVTYEQDSGIPVNADLEVSEILPEDERYETLLQEALQAAGKESAAYARFFDIEIRSGEEKIEPEEKVSVRIALDDIPEAVTDEMTVVHFAADETVVLDADTVNTADIRFETDSFSVYGVITYPTAQPQGVNDLGGRSATIGRNGFYLTSNGTTSSNPHKLYSTTNPGEAAKWQFESAGQEGEYYISTMVDGTRKYLSLNRHSGTVGHLELTDEPQAITVAEYGNGYSLSAEVSRNGGTWTYYVWGRDGNGFWSSNTENDAAYELTLSFDDAPTAAAGNEYAVVIKYEDSYYTVKPDGTLEPAVYDPATNTVQIEYPLTWHYDGNTLSVETEGKTFNGFGNTADSFYYRYISTDRGNGLYDEHDDEGESSNTAIQYSNNRIQGSGSNAGKYIGVAEDENGKLRIVGLQDESSAAEVYLADVQASVPRSSAKYHTVSHIDISIHGNALASYPLPSGTYYYENGETLVVDKTHPKTLELSAKPDITKEDIKNAGLVATDKNGNIVENAYYVTGYSGNAGDNNNNPDLPTQIRIEGSFKVADNITVPYPEGYPETVNEATESGLLGNSAHQEIKRQRKENQITYTVTTTKEVTFTLTDGDRILYDADGNPLTITVPVTLSGSCEYWSEKNTCPGIPYSGEFGRQAWSDGCIVGDGRSLNTSGIDFTLGGKTSLNQPEYPTVVINKFITDSNREPLSIQGTVTNSFTIWQAVSGSGYSEYQYAGKVNVDVSDANGLGSMGVGSFELNVNSAMVYIQEDNAEEALPRTVVVDGGTWEYVKTVIETECVKTDDPAAHTSGDLTLHDENYNSQPEAAGYYTDNGEAKFQERLHFYVYNIYEPVLTIKVEKNWDDGNGIHADDSVGVQLIRYKKSGGTPPEPEKGTLVISHESDGLPMSPDLPEGFTVTYSYTGPESGSGVSAGSYSVTPGEYEVTATVTNSATPEGYTYSSTTGPVTVTVPANGSQAAQFTSSYEPEAPVEYATVFIRVDYSENGLLSGDNTGISISVPKNSRLSFSYSSFYYQPWWSTVEPGWELYYYQYTTHAEYVSAGQGSNTPGTYTIEIGDRDTYGILIKTNPDFASELHPSLSRIQGTNQRTRFRIFNPRLLTAADGGASGSIPGLPDGYTVDNEFDGNATLSESNSWSYTFAGLPVCDGDGNPYYYELVEAVPDGYIPVYDPEGPWEAEAGEKTFTVTNTPDVPTTGDLTVSKTVAGNAGETDRFFEFTITLTNKTNLNETFGDVVFTGGVATIYLKDGESKTIPDLPADAEYTVAETSVNAEGYVTTVTGDAEGIITTDGREVSFTNTRNIVPVSVSKDWAEWNAGTAVPGDWPTQDGQANPEYITVKLQYKEQDDTYTDVPGVDTQKIYPAGSGQPTAAVFNLPADGKEYRIVETDTPEGYAASIADVVSGTDEYTITNTRIPEVDITAAKDWGTGNMLNAAAVRFTLYRKVADAGEADVPDGAVRIPEESGPWYVPEGEPQTVTASGGWQAEWTGLPGVANPEAPAEDWETNEYIVRETGVYFGTLENGELPEGAEFREPDMYSVASGDGAVTYGAGADASTGTAEITNNPDTADVPVTKTWADFDSDSRYDWSATFRLQWAPLYEEEDIPSVPYEDVAEDGSKDITITKAQMQKVLNGTETDEEKALRSFRDLDKYGVDGRGRIYRILYTLEETGYTVTENGTVIYSYDKETGVYVPADLIYEAKYPHTAGTNSGKDEDYYISANNIRRSIKGEKHIDITVRKAFWEGYLEDDEASATFKVHRYKTEGYRELGSVNPDADPVTVTLVTTDGTVIDTLQVYPGTDVQVSVTFKEHTETKSVSIGNPYNQTLTVYYGPKETKLTNAVSITEDTTVTVTSLNAEDLDGGLAGIRLMDYVITTPAAPDTEYEAENVTFTLNKAGNWITSPPLHLLAQETAEGETASREYVYTYEYWFEEISSSPEGFYAQFFRRGTETEVDSNNRISRDANVDAKNEEKPKFVVQKLWRGVENPVDYPDITFDLYQVEVSSEGYPMGQGRIAKRPDGTSYTGITLSYSADEDESYTWICPEVLPTEAANGNNLAYYVVENPSQSTGDGLVWSIYGYSHGNYHKEEEGYYTADDPTLATQPENAKVNGNDGCIVIHNTSSKYIQMDIQKQFFIVTEDGSWHNVTAVSDDSRDDVHKGIVLGYTLIRRIIDRDDDSHIIRGWHDYGNEFKVGFDAEGNPVMDDGGNNFCLKPANPYAWEYSIKNESANLNSDVVGLPSYGVYEDENGETIPVKYNYSYRETGVYCDLDGTPHPKWEWISSPPNIYIDENGNGVDHFGLAFANHDGKRTVNYQASSITVDKRWLGQPDAQEVYVKIFRKSGSGAEEDFTEIIAEDLRGYEGFEITNWQHYVEDTSLVDTDNNWIVIKSNNEGNWTTTIKTHRAPLMPQNQNSQSAYQYYIREVGYKDHDGNIHLTEEDPHALDVYETRYTRWDAETGRWLEAAVADPTDASIVLGQNNTNRLQVMNAPMMDLTVSKKWYERDGQTEKDPWNTSVSFMVRQVRTRWVDGAATDEQETVYLKAGTDNIIFTLHENGQTAVLTTDHLHHDTYGMTVADDSAVDPWTIVLSGLQRGYFDENGHEWHCTYEAEEVDAVDSIVTYEGTELHSDSIVIRNVYDEPVKIRIIKVDAVSGRELDGAVFQLKKQEGTEFVDYQSSFTVNGSAEIERLTDGTYRLEEIQAPAGYMPLSEPVQFTVTGKTVSCSATGSAVAFDPADNSFTIRNRPGVELPNTGGPGTTLYTIPGLIMILLGGGMLARRKRRALKGRGQD